MTTTGVRLCTAAALLTICASQAHALDFILHSTTIVDDGITKEQFYVQMDDRTSVLLSLPTRWSRNDSPASLTLIAPDIINSLLRLEKSSLGPDTPFADHGLEAYHRRAQADVPQGATAVKVNVEHDQPLPIFGWKDHEFIFLYDFFGQQYKRSVLFVNLDSRQQIMLTCVAPADRFDEVRSAGLDVLRSWQVVPTP